MSDGLEGIVAAETVLSHADGEQGILLVRGHNITDVVARHGYEGAVALLWDGFAGEGLTRARILGQLGAGRVRAFSELGDWLPAATQRPALCGPRIALAAMRDESTPAEIAATLPVAIAALLRAHAGKTPVPPDSSLTTAADFLRMVSGCAVEQRFVTALESYLATVIDNGLATSTFAARVIISTRASLVCAVLGAYGAFSGALHGGAPGLALDMLDEIAASGDVDGWLDRTLNAGGRLIGFGHRVFRIRDPRADILRAALLQLDPDSKRLAFMREVERAALGAPQAAQARPSSRKQYRDGRRPPPRRHRPAARGVHASLRHGTRAELDRACIGAEAHRPHDPPELGLYRPPAALALGSRPLPARLMVMVTGREKKAIDQAMAPKQA
jgi:citrate synthase